jgi:hypothetical protein
MRCRVALVRTNVSEERITSIIRVETIATEVILIWTYVLCQRYVLTEPLPSKFSVNTQTHTYTQLGDLICLISVFNVWICTLKMDNLKSCNLLWRTVPCTGYTKLLLAYFKHNIVRSWGLPLYFNIYVLSLANNFSLHAVFYFFVFQSLPSCYFMHFLLPLFVLPFL